jgi:hypothetical protein
MTASRPPFRYRGWRVMAPLLPLMIGRLRGVQIRCGVNPDNRHVWYPPPNSFNVLAQA